MKKFAVGLYFLILMLLPFASANAVLNLGAGKDGLLSKTAQKIGYAQATDTSLASNLGLVVKIALGMTGMIFMALMVYAGYLWMTARGESEPVDKAKEIVRGSIIGLVLVFAAYSITNYIVPKILEKATAPQVTAPAQE